MRIKLTACIREALQYAQKTVLKPGSNWPWPNWANEWVHEIRWGQNISIGTDQKYRETIVTREVEFLIYGTVVMRMTMEGHTNMEEMKASTDWKAQKFSYATQLIKSEGEWRASFWYESGYMLPFGGRSLGLGLVLA